MSETQVFQHTFPTLYKLSSNKTHLQRWDISVSNTTITTRYGHVDGAELSTQDTITEGKNVGRSNATTAEEQALAEARSRWEKQRKRGYVSDIDAAKRGEVSDAVEGGVLPMLAKVFEEHADKITYPVAVQPKLDGHRLTADITVRHWSADSISNWEVNVDLWTRTRKRVTSVPHIASALVDTFENEINSAQDSIVRLLDLGFTAENEDSGDRATIYSLTLDGELYNHELSEDFERLSSLARQSEPHPDATVLQYHIYDVVSSQSFQERIAKLEHLFSAHPSLRLVETVYASTPDEVFSHHKHFTNQGYEGAMVRQLSMPYEHKRSAQLLKLKDFLDGEFLVTNAEEGRGKLNGCVGAFVLQTPDGKTFRAKWAASEAELRNAFQNPHMWVGKLAVVKYQNLSADGIPRFPVLLRRRNDL